MINKQLIFFFCSPFRTMMANIPVITVLFSLSWVVGMVIFTSYADCDPKSWGYTTNYDEIVPFYVDEKFVYLPGLLGLVMATLFNSSLTITVSILNSLATVTFEDFLSQIPAMRNLKDTQQLRIIKILAVFYGFLVIGISFLVGMLSGVIESSMLMTSATSGPLLGVFVLAMLVPCANWKGAAAGMIFSHVTTMWLTFGHLSLDIPNDELPLSTDGCRNDSFAPHMNRVREPKFWSSATKESLFDEETPETILDNIYGVTYMYYALIGSLSTIIVGIVVSLLTADSKEDAYEEHLLHPLVLKLSKMMPGKPRLFAPSSCYNNENNNANGTVVVGNGHVDENVKRTLQQDYHQKAAGHLDNGYAARLNSLKKVTLEVTSEVQKGTKI